MEKTRQPQEEKKVEENGREIDNQQEPDKKENIPSLFSIKGDENLIKLDDISFEMLVNGRKNFENGDDKSEMNVYYDKEEGIWKCRNCPWIYQSGSAWTKHTEYPKSVDRQEPCFYCEIKGAKSICRFRATQNNGVAHESTQFNREPLKEKKGNTYLNVITITSDGVEPEEDADEKLTEFDVKKVLKEQGTDDLYSPNCNSCINEKVIICKRKCKTSISIKDAKRNKFEAVERLRFTSEDTNSVRDEEVFRCLSCFCFFVDSGHGFQLFKVFGDNSDEHTSRLVSPTKKSSFSSNLVSEIEGRGSKRNMSGNIIGEENHLQLDTSYQIDSSEFSNEMQLNSEKHCLVNQFSEKILQDIGKIEFYEIQQNGLKIQDTNYYPGSSSTVTMKAKENTYFEEPIKAVRDNLIISIKDSIRFPGKKVETTKELTQNPAKSARGVVTYIAIEHLVQSRYTQEPQGLILAETPHLPHRERVEYERFQGIDIVKSIVYGGLAEFIASLGIVSSAVGADTVTLKILALGLANLIRGLFIICQKLWDLKSEKPLNPTNQITENNNIQLTTQEDRYEQLLGRRKYFRAQVAIVLLSFLIFGMLPPVVYAFSFRESDNKDYKFVAVATVSLVCILILSTGKAYISRSSKAYLRTVRLYVIMVFMLSGVSYALGTLFKKLLENLEWFRSDLDLRLPVLEKSI